MIHFFISIPLNWQAMLMDQIEFPLNLNWNGSSVHEFTLTYIVTGRSVVCEECKVLLGGRQSREKYVRDLWAGGRMSCGNCSVEGNILLEDLRGWTHSDRSSTRPCLSLPFFLASFSQKSLAIRTLRRQTTGHNTNHFYFSVNGFSGSM